MRATRLALYLDTSTLGAVFDRDLPERSRTSVALLEKLVAGDHEAFVSDLTLREIAAAPSEVRQGLEEWVRRLRPVGLREDEESRALARRYLDAGVFPRHAAADARHVALASVFDLDVVVSWNFKHMVNPRRRNGVLAVNLPQGYPMIDLAAPTEVLEVGP